jgi:anaerobic carbon-monoxide dehydrogenase iron sulfur subunit
MENVLIADADKCTGCKVCELVCSMTKFEEFNPGKSYIKIIQNRPLGVNIPTVSAGCDSCGKCVEWCFDRAIKFVNPEEAAVIRREAKLGCFPAPSAD